MILKKEVLLIVICSLLIGKLSAIELIKEFYPSGNIPKEFEYFTKEGSITTIELKGWPNVEIIDIIEKNLLEKRTKKIGILKSGKGINPRLVLSSDGYIPGFPMTYVFKSPKVNREITIIPNKIFIKSKLDHARIEAKVTNFNPAAYEIIFEDFADNEKLVCKTISYDEVIEHKITFKQKQTMMLFPEVINKNGGVAHLSLFRPSGEILKLELPYGLEWLSFIKGLDENGNVKGVIDFLDSMPPNVREYFKDRSNK